MNNKTHRGLLPNGLGDTLPPEAEFEAQITETLMASFTKYGYERVKPPLIEFEDVLLTSPLDRRIRPHICLCKTQ